MLLQCAVVPHLLHPRVPGRGRSGSCQNRHIRGRALASLADTRAECSGQQTVINAEDKANKAMQCSVKESLRANNQQQTVQSAKVDAMGYHLEEMNDLFLQHEPRMEVQMDGRA